jgi:hypothetical protein
MRSAKTSKLRYSEWHGFCLPIPHGLLLSSASCLITNEILKAETCRPARTRDVSGRGMVVRASQPCRSCRSQQNRISALLGAKPARGRNRHDLKICNR